jgi:hypothetical protein
MAEMRVSEIKPDHLNGVSIMRHILLGARTTSIHDRSALACQWAI